jgi:phosphopantothenate-cysteine ligase
VIGNDLHRRKQEVVFVEPVASPTSSTLPTEKQKFKETWIHLEKDATEIEEAIIRELVNRHTGWIERGGTDGSAAAQP